MKTSPTPKPAVDPLAATAPQPRVEAPAVEDQPSVDPALLAELERLTAENRALLQALEETTRAREILQGDVDELLRDAPHRSEAPAGDGLAATTQALCDVYRLTQAGGADRERFYAAAIRGGELLAERLAPPPPDAG